MSFSDALFSIQTGLKVIREEVLNDPFTKSYYVMLHEGMIRRVYCDNGLICSANLTNNDLLANDWYVYTEED
jgi:hypothetical protein